MQYHISQLSMLISSGTSQRPAAYVGFRLVVPYSTTFYYLVSDSSRCLVGSTFYGLDIENSWEISHGMQHGPVSSGYQRGVKDRGNRPDITRPVVVIVVGTPARRCRVLVVGACVSSAQYVTPLITWLLARIIGSNK